MKSNRDVKTNGAVLRLQFSKMTAGLESHHITHLELAIGAPLPAGKT